MIRTRLAGWLSLGLPVDMTSFLWVLLGSYLAPQYYGTNSILVMQASK
jgi:hypothetical protein